MVQNQLLSINSMYDTGMREGIVQVLEYLLPDLPHKSLAGALWSLRTLPFIGEERAITYILEYMEFMEPTYTCYQHIDVGAANFIGMNYTNAYYYAYDEPPEGGDIICLMGQNLASENGKYLYTGHKQPLIR
jgi:hypothetical protein